MLRPTRILVPTDFSAFSDKALEQALDISKQYGAEVYLLHVVKPPEPCGLKCAVPGNILEQLEKDAHDGAARDIKEQLDKFPQPDGIKIFPATVQGQPRQVILGVAEKKKIDLIVIASLGQSGIAKYLIGSVARSVLKGSKCPVLLTK